MDSRGQTISHSAEIIKLETAPEGHALIDEQLTALSKLHTAVKDLIMNQLDRLKSLNENADKADQLTEQVLNIIQKLEESIEKLDTVHLQQKLKSIKVAFCVGLIIYRSHW